MFFAVPAHGDATGTEHARPTPFQSPYIAPASLFDALDANGSGDLDPSEIGSDIPGQHHSDLDLDKSGAITLGEWEVAFLGTWAREPMHTELLAEYFVWLMSEAMKIPDMARALQVGKEGLAAFPESYRLNLNVGWLAHTMGVLDLAENCAAMGREIRPDRSDALCLAAAVEHSRGDYSGEETLLIRASQLPGHNPCGELTLARRYMSRNEPGQARDFLLAALERDGWAPKVDKELRLPLARAAFDLGNIEEAGYHALRAVSLDTRSDRAWQLLAEYFRVVGHVELSREILGGISTNRQPVPPRREPVPTERTGDTP